MLDKYNQFMHFTCAVTLLIIRKAKVSGVIILSMNNRRADLFLLKRDLIFAGKFRAKFKSVISKTMATVSTYLNFPRNTEEAFNFTELSSGLPSRVKESCVSKMSRNQSQCHHFRMQTKTW